MTQTWAHYESGRQDQHTIFVYDNECSPLESLGLRPGFHVFIQNFFQLSHALYRPQALIRVVLIFAAMSCLKMQVDLQ